MTRILIAEHNTEVSQFLKKELKGAYNIVHIVDNSRDAWRMIGQDDYDVLMINIIMPGIDGFVLAQKALQMNPGIQIIFITGFAAVAMDTYNTPSYAPRPVTSRPFHLRDIAPRVRFFMGEADLPFDQVHSYQVPAHDDNVIYARFGEQTTTSSGQG